MQMGRAGMIGVCGCLALASVGCNKVSKDNSKVIASVGGDKLTEKAFKETVHIFVDDAAKEKDLLTNPAMREQRNQILDSLMSQKALFQYIKTQGLDKDPKVRIQVESAMAATYFTALADRLVPKAEPTDAQLKTFYDDYVLQAKAANQASGIPPFDQVKAQLPEAWKRKQAQNARQTLLAQLNQKYPVVFAPDYKPSQAQ